MPETTVEIRSPDGDWTTLLGPSKGDRGVFLGEDIEGLFDDEPSEGIYNSHAFQRGATFGGVRIDKKDVTFDALITNTADATWQENYSAWRRSWSLKRKTQMWVETEGSRRWIDVRLAKHMRVVAKIDPNKNEYGVVSMFCVAEDPSFLEPDATDSWVSTVDTLGGGTTSGTVTVSNPTDNDLWLKWVLQAYPGAVYTLPDFSFGDDRFERATADAGRRIVMPPLLAGEHIRVDTDEEALQVVSNIDTQVYIRMKGVSFLYPVPAGTKKLELPVSVSKAPAGVGVQVRCPRKWSSGMGL